MIKYSGEVGAEIGRKNREAVLKFFKENPWATRRECAAATGLSEFAVGRHVTALKAEWLEARKANAHG